LVFLVRACAMHLARRSLVEESEVSPRVSAGSFFLETPPPSKQHASSRRLIASASPNEADRDDAEESETDERESVLDWEVAGLMSEALSRVEGRITSFDNRHVILLLEALALVGFAPGSLVDKTLQTCVLPRVCHLRPEELLGLLQAVAALDVQFDELLQAMGERVTEILPQFELAGLVSLASHFTDLEFPPRLLLSELASRLDEAAATLDDDTLRQMEVLFARHGLPHESICARLETELCPQETGTN
ncbi:hypothetical protein TGARI_244570B, partial [Toxoplasma gondii ARI]